MSELELVKARIAAAQKPEFGHVYGVTILAVDYFVRSHEHMHVSCMVSSYPTDKHPIGTVLGVYLPPYGDRALLRACDVVTSYHDLTGKYHDLTGKTCRLKTSEKFTRLTGMSYILPTWMRAHEFGDEPECEKCGIYGPDGGEHEPCEPQQQKKEG